MTDEQAELPAPEAEAPAPEPGATPNVESLRVTVDANGMVVPDGDPSGQTVLTGQDAAKAMAATAKAGKGPRSAAKADDADADADADEEKASRAAESKARKAAPEDKGR
jgi:hypothetical protein